MNGIMVDHSCYVARRQREPDANQTGLWTFHIQEQDVCFWGGYCEAVSTALRYAECHGMLGGSIVLVDVEVYYRQEVKN
jgi:hypothetical protein